MFSVHFCSKVDNSIKVSFQSVAELLEWRRHNFNGANTLSVIIPAFNTKLYISDALESVCANAVHVDLEIIVIDDGSTDETADVAFEYLSELSWVKFIIVRTENAGLSAARNLGVEIACGEYIAFLDSDDFVSPMGYVNLVEFAASKKCDMVFARSVAFADDRMTFSRFPDAEVWDKLISDNRGGVFYPAIAPCLFATEPNANVRVWRRKFVLEKKLLYPEGRHFEDIGVHLISIASAYRIGVLDFNFYYYRMGRPGQITAGRSVKRFDVISNVRDCLQNSKIALLKGEAAARALYSILRIVRWCGSEVMVNLRPAFKREQDKLFLEIPGDWWDSYARIYGERSLKI